MNAKKKIAALAILRAVVISWALAGGVAQAQFSSTWTVASDYDFRGASNSAGEPVLQASLDYEMPTGFWIGAWASNFDYGPGYDGDVELDAYAGYSHELSETRSCSAGVTAYMFPDSDAPIEIHTSFEAYVDVTLGGFQVAQWYSPDFGKLGASALYSEANYTWELPREWRLRAHGGYAWGDYWDDDALGGGTLADFALTLARDVGNFTLSAKLTGTDAGGARRIESGPFRNDARLVVAIETTIPR